MTSDIRQNGVIIWKFIFKTVFPSLKAMSSVNPVVSSGPAPNPNQAQLDNLDRSHRTIIGTVELALHEHEERVRSSVVLAGIFTAILTPIVLYALDKLAWTSFPDKTIFPTSNVVKTSFQMSKPVKTYF